MPKWKCRFLHFPLQVFATRLNFSNETLKIKKVKTFCLKKSTADPQSVANEGGDDQVAGPALGGAGAEHGV